MKLGGCLELEKLSLVLNDFKDTSYVAYLLQVVVVTLLPKFNNLLDCIRVHSPASHLCNLLGKGIVFGETLPIPSPLGKEASLSI